MKYTKAPTINAMQEMSRQMKEKTGAATNIKIEVWKYTSDTEEVRFSMWTQSNSNIISASTWTEFVSIYKKELENATKHS